MVLFQTRAWFRDFVHIQSELEECSLRLRSVIYVATAVVAVAATVDISVGDVRESVFCLAE